MIKNYFKTAWRNLTRHKTFSLLNIIGLALSISAGLIDWWVFALGGLVTIIIALVTVGLKAIKAAVANPAKSLKTE